MYKITVTVSDKDKDNCTVKIQAPKEKQLEKASETEKSTGAMVYNTISEALQKLN